MCEPASVNHKGACKQFANNVSNHKRGPKKSHNLRNILMAYIRCHELLLLFFIYLHKFYNSNVDFFLKVMLCETIF